MGGGIKQKIIHFCFIYKFFKKFVKSFWKYLKFVAEPSFENPTRALNLNENSWNLFNYSLVVYQYQMKRRFKNSNLSLHDQTWFLKQQKKISLKPLLLYILYNYYNWQLEFLCAYDVRFQSVYNGRNFKKKFFFLF